MDSDRVGNSILIVEDDSLVSETLKKMIESNGSFFIQQASSGQEALRVLEYLDVDIILSDIQMPGMDGIELLRKVKASIPLIPVAIITGFPSIDIAIKAMKEGASDFIVKPFQMEKIDLLIQKLVHERKLLLENSKLNRELQQKKEIENLNDALSKKVKELTLLYNIGEAFNTTSFDRDNLFDKVVEYASEISGARKSSLMIMDPDINRLIVKASKGLSVKEAEEKSVRIGEGIAGKAAAEGKPMLIEDIYGSPDIVEALSGKYEKGTAISAPIFIKGKTFGVVNVADKDNGGQFSGDDVKLLLMMVQRAALSLENYTLYESVYNNLVDTLLSLVSTIEAKDPYTKLHSHRVTQWSIEIAKTMKLPQGDIDIIKSAGILHDIGKIGIPDSVLMKPGKLTDEEYQIIKTHPTIGENIVMPLNLLPQERALIRNHHERWDGNGYPDGLKGEENPLVARILAVADSYDAMTSERVYREAKKEKVALSEIKRCSGSQFDPDVVESFFGMVEKYGEKIALSHNVDIVEAPSFIHPRFKGMLHGGSPLAKRFRL